MYFKSFYICYFVVMHTCTYTLHTSSTRSHTAYRLIHFSISSFFRNTFLFFAFLPSPFSLSVSFDICLFLSLSLFSRTFQCLFDSFVSSYASSRAPPYLFAHRRYLHCVPMSDLICAKRFADRCKTKEVLTRKGGVENVLSSQIFVHYLIAAHTKSSYSSLVERKMTLNLFFAARVSRGKRRSTYLHVPSIRAYSRETLAHKCGHRRALHDVAKLYANCESPCELNARLFRVRRTPYTRK